MNYPQGRRFWKTVLQDTFFWETWRCPVKSIIESASACFVFRIRKTDSRLNDHGRSLCFIRTKWKYISTNDSVQILIPRPSKVRLCDVEMNRGNGEPLNVDLVFPRSKWCVYNFEKDGTVTKRYPRFSSSNSPKDEL